MLKIKSKSKQIKEFKDIKQVKQLSPYSKYLVPFKRNQTIQRKPSKSNKKRNHSNQHITSPLNFMEKIGTTKHRDFHSAKNHRKDVQNRFLELDVHPFRNNLQEAKQLRKTFHNTFIGSKLKRKIQKYLLFLALINYSMKISTQRLQTPKYKVFIGKGNNSKLMKKIFITRFWWTITSNIHDANLIWTQKTKKHILDKIQNTGKQYKIEGERLPTIKEKSIKYKKKQLKKLETQVEFDLILNDKVKQQLKRECRKQSLLEDLRHTIKKSKLQKRSPLKMTCNHIENHKLLSNKKNLFYCLKDYCNQNHESVFKYIPFTFHITLGNDEQYEYLQKYEEQLENSKNKQKLLWIVKPGENSNRGCGIQVCKKVAQIKKIVEKQKQKHKDRTFIAQRYIIPFLFHRRKFDIRMFVLIVSNPTISAYFYPIGYIRTSSIQFNLKNCQNKFIHLTNDAIQKKGSQYSKFENGNKVRFQQFQKYLDQFQSAKHYDFFKSILPALKEMVLLSIKTFAFSSKQSMKSHTFELLGYDFMLDENFNPWLIEINTNPCIETGCDILNDIIPKMLQNTMKIAVDSVFKPPKIQEWPFNQLLTCSEKILQTNKFELIYQEIVDKTNDN